MTSSVSSVSSVSHSLDPDGVINLLSKVLRGTPKLEDAACVGRWPGLWDPPGQGETLDHPDVEYRHGIALGICRSCPALDLCRGWVDSLPGNKRPGGVVAGRLPNSERVAA